MRWLWLVSLLVFFGLLITAIVNNPTNQRRWTVRVIGHVYTPEQGHVWKETRYDHWSGTEWSVIKDASGTEQWTPIVNKDNVWDLVDTERHPEFAEFDRQVAEVEYQMKKLKNVVFASWRWYVEHYRQWSQSNSDYPFVWALAQFQRLKLAFEEERFVPPELPPPPPANTRAKMPTWLSQGYDTYASLYERRNEIQNEKEKFARKLAVEYAYQKRDLATWDWVARWVLGLVASLVVTAVLFYHGRYWIAERPAEKNLPEAK